MHEQALTSRTDYEDLSDFCLSHTELAGLVGTSGECVFNWTTASGYPMGVVVRYLHRDGKFFTTSVARRARIRALRSRPQTAIVLNHGGRSATFKGVSVLYRPGEPGWEAIKSWFFPALAGTDEHPDDPAARRIERYLDNPNQVIVETTADLVLSFDFTRFSQAQLAPLVTEAAE